MIPNAYLQEWSTRAPWPDLRQIEQDLIICRALCDLFSHPFLAQRIAFRGGTAIHKLLFPRPLRYSEDIDLTQTTGEPIGATVEAIRNALSWLGRPGLTQAGHSIHLRFKFAPEADAAARMNVKIEINTREHGSLLGFKTYPFRIESGWHKAETQIVSFEHEELFATKLRALLQRRKNRDLFDLTQGLAQLRMDHAQLIACFEHYLALEGTTIHRALAEQRMLEKLNKNLTEDISPLLPAGAAFTDDDAMTAFQEVWVNLISRLPGSPWKLSTQVIESIRLKNPGFLQTSSE